MIENQDKKTEEEIIQRILEALDHGASLDELQVQYENFPEALKTVSLFVQKTDLVKESVRPDRDVVSRMVSRIKDEHKKETTLLVHRYDTILYLMKNVLKIGLPVLAVLLIVIGVNMQKKDTQTAQNSLDQKVMEGDQAPLIPKEATGNIDDIALSFESELVEETSIVQSTNSDADIATIDSDIITNYGNTYDETQF